MRKPGFKGILNDTEGLFNKKGLRLSEIVIK